MTLMSTKHKINLHKNVETRDFCIRAVQLNEVVINILKLERSITNIVSHRKMLFIIHRYKTNSPFTLKYVTCTTSPSRHTKPGFLHLTSVTNRENGYMYLYNTFTLIKIVSISLQHLSYIFVVHATS